MLTLLPQLLNNLLSSIDPAVASQSSVPGGRQTPGSGTPKPVQRPASGLNGVSQSLKRKADDEPGGAQPKIQRKESTPLPTRPNGSARPAPIADSARSKPTASATSIPYRGTAGIGAAKPVNGVTRKAGLGAYTANPTGRPAPAPVPPPKTVGSTQPAATAKKGSYAAMLAKAKEVQQTKPAPPPLKHEPTKILTKKERMALREQASAVAKGKKPATSGAGAVVKAADNKAGPVERRKTVEVGYQGTARPIKKPSDLGYKGTARPIATATASAGRAGASGAPKPKAKPKDRHSGYVEWSDLDEVEDEGEDYDSEGSSDMEGGMFDLEREEQEALKFAKKEDAKELAEELRLKREKEERKQKLMAMSKAAAGKRKY
jgi:hypothetical protein